MEWLAVDGLVKNMRVFRNKPECGNKCPEKKKKIEAREEATGNRPGSGHQGNELQLGTSEETGSGLECLMECCWFFSTLGWILMMALIDLSCFRCQ